MRLLLVSLLLGISTNVFAETVRLKIGIDYSECEGTGQNQYCRVPEPELQPVELALDAEGLGEWVTKVKREDVVITTRVQTCVGRCGAKVQFLVLQEEQRPYSNKVRKLMELWTDSLHQLNRVSVDGFEVEFAGGSIAPSILLGPAD